MTNKNNIELSIILVNWNGGQVTLNCIESLYKTIKETAYEIVLVDNNSSDGSCEEICRRYPKVIVIKNSYNNMFAGANNQGYEVCRGRYIFLLNTDTVATERSVDSLVAVLRRGKESVVTCTLLNRDGSIQYNMHRGFPTVIRLITGLAYKRWKFFGVLPSVKDYLLTDNKFTQNFYLDQAAGAAIMISRDLVSRLGYLFDEINFPLFFNDVDLCYRVSKIGSRILCVTSVKIFHLKGDAIKKINFSKHMSIYCNSVLRYYLKHSIFSLDKK